MSVESIEWPDDEDEPVEGDDDVGGVLATLLAVIVAAVVVCSIGFLAVVGVAVHVW